MLYTPDFLTIITMIKFHRHDTLSYRFDFSAWKRYPLACLVSHPHIWLTHLVNLFSPAISPIRGLFFLHQQGRLVAWIFSPI